MVSQTSILLLKLPTIFRYNLQHVDREAPEPVPSTVQIYQVWLGSLLCAQTAPRLGEPFFLLDDGR